MAFGALKGTWTFGANSIVANNQATLATGVSTVAKGDLIVVVIGEVVANTSSGATDTLGNTYTAATVGTLGGGVSGRAFYTIVTNAGTNTNVNVQATASANNVSITAASFEGSFSAVDKTPANNNNTDNASPFTCPTTGTLSQAIEVVIGWMVQNTVNNLLATSPNTKANQQNQVTISSILGYQRVNVTTAVLPAFTGTNPTGSQQGTLSFRAADLPENQPLLALPVIWPPYHAFLRTWTFSPQLEEVVAEALPFNQANWPNPTQPYYLEGPQGTWAQNRTIVPAAESLQARAPFYTQRVVPQWSAANIGPTPLTLFTPPTPPPTELNRPRAPHHSRPWELKGFITDIPYNVALRGAAPTPFRQLDWPLPTAPYRSLALQTWVDQTKLLLTRPTRQQDWPLPIGPQPVQTWLQSVNLALNTVVTGTPFVQEDWPTPKGFEQPIRSLTVSYNLNLIGQDKLPTGAEVTGLPPQPAQQPIPIFTATYNKNLIGQDKLPTGADLTDLPPRDYERSIQLRTWIYNTSLALLAGPQVRPFVQSDWPINIGPRQPTTIFAATYNKNLVGQDRLPNRQMDWPTPQARARDAITWIDRHKSYLQRPHRQTDWPLALAPQQTTRTWIQAVNVALTPPVAGVPFSQSDWPVPKGAAPQLQTWVNSFNALYIPPGAKPFNQQDWPLPRDPRRLSDWIFRTNPNLLQPTPPLPFNQDYWPLPGRYPLLLQQSVFWEASLFQPPWVPPPLPPPGRTRQIVVGSE